MWRWMEAVTTWLMCFFFVITFVWLICLTIGHIELTAKVEGLIKETYSLHKEVKELNNFTKRADNFTSTFLDLSKKYNESFAAMNDRIDILRNRVDDLESTTKSQLKMHLESINKADKELSDLHSSSFVKRYQLKDKCFV